MRVDWSFIKPLWCVGGLSNYEIARQYNEIHADQDAWSKTVTETAIRKQARKESWQKQIADKVKKQVREKLVRNEFAMRTSDDEIIDQAAETVANVIMLHRKDIDQLKALEADLLRRLAEDETQIEVGWYQGSASEHLVKLGLDQRTKVYQRLVQAIASRITIERRAWGIDDETDPGAADKIEINMIF